MASREHPPDGEEDSQSARRRFWNFGGRFREEASQPPEVLQSPGALQLCWSGNGTGAPPVLLQMTIPHPPGNPPSVEARGGCCGSLLEDPEATRESKSANLVWTPGIELMLNGPPEGTRFLSRVAQRCWG
eukprot:GHVS01098780.1.p2 GENE.GHVS01098780.1~~GHVS01098780.1.p2  ORF type:complete len:130 (+),score=10.94 GHVS01098780.1:185-574(+)